MALGTILLVEDSPTYASLATMLLEVSGYRVLLAATAEEALRLAREARPGLILMDMNLPGMDGLDAVRLLRKDPRTKDIPAVALTADRITSETQREGARSAGFEAYVEKPIDETEFRALVARFLGAVDGRGEQ